MKLPLGRCAGSRAKGSYLRSGSPLSRCINKLPDTQRSNRSFIDVILSPASLLYRVAFDLESNIAKHQLITEMQVRIAQRFNNRVQSTTRFSVSSFHFSGALNGTVADEICSRSILTFTLRTCVVETWQIVSTLIAPEFDANRSNNFKLRFRSPTIATIYLQSRETRRGERQCHSELHIAITTLQHLIL